MKPFSFPEQVAFITDIFSNTRLRQDFVASIVKKLQVWTGCHCVGIRIVNPDDYMPYEAYVGFSQEFWEHENWLSLREHECGCTRIVTNETLPVDRPLLTEKGSILSNDLQAFGASLTATEAGLYRGKCIECGFGSLALVPIRKQGEVVGLIHLADKRTNLLPLSMVQTLESLTAPIAEVIKRFSTEEHLACQKAENEAFFYSITHDLKSPLITARSFLAMLRQDLLDEKDEQIKEDLDYIDKSTGKMHQMLEALLRYARISRKDDLSQTVVVNEQIENCVATLAGILRQQSVQVMIHAMPYRLHGDPLHFGQIWQNLIENAVKYMGDQTQPQIEIGAIQQAQDVLFYVRDNGMGIKHEHQQRIFNLFSKLDPTSDGIGLGLTMLKKIVSIYRGRVWVESAGEGQGSCFFFTLPDAANY